MKTKPIVYLINQYPAVSHTFIRREILALERQGVDVVRIAVRDGRSLVDPLDAEEMTRTVYLLKDRMRLLWATVHVLATRPLGFAKASLMALRLMRRSDRPPLVHILYLIEACCLARVVHKTGARHIHAHFGTNPAEVALLAARLCGVTYSFTVHGCEEYDKPEFIGLKVKMREAAFVAAVSHYGCAQLLRWCDRADQRKITLVRCGLEPEYHQSADDTLGEVARFVCVARFCRLKAQDVLLKAAAKLAGEGHTFELVLVGDGETRPELEALIRDLRLSACVRMTGWLSGARVREEVQAARALVVPSFAENLPVVIMEAMALRRPVIATYIGGIPELVIAGETGWLVPASCVSALADSMKACLSASDNELRDLGRRAQERVLALHDVDREAAKLAALFP